MKKLTKIIVVIFIISIMVSVFALPVSATTTYTNWETDFRNSWFIEVACYDYYNGAPITQIGVIKYGFNTFLVNEDFVNTTGYSNSNSTAKVKRYGYDSDYLSGPTKIAGVKSIKEVTHNTSKVYYRMTLSYTLASGHSLFPVIIDSD